MSLRWEIKISYWGSFYLNCFISYLSIKTIKVISVNTIKGWKKMEVRKDHWKVKGNFQEVAKSREDFLKVGRVDLDFWQRIRSHFRGRWINYLHVLPCLFLFHSVAVLLLSGLVLGKEANHPQKVAEKQSSGKKNDCD